MKKVNKKKGFTLAELLVVIAIIAILIAIAIPTFSGALDGAKKATDDANIRSAFAQFQIACLTADPPVTGNSYTPTDDDIAACLNGGTITFSAGNTVDVDGIGFTNGTAELQYYDGINTSVTPWVGN